MHSRETTSWIDLHLYLRQSRFHSSWQKVSIERLPFLNPLISFPFPPYLLWKQKFNLRTLSQSVRTRITVIFPPPFIVHFFSCFLCRCYFFLFFVFASERREMFSRPYVFGLSVFLLSFLFCVCMLRRDGVLFVPPAIFRVHGEKREREEERTVLSKPSMYAFTQHIESCCVCVYVFIINNGQQFVPMYIFRENLSVLTLWCVSDMTVEGIENRKAMHFKSDSHIVLSCSRSPSLILDESRDLFFVVQHLWTRCSKLSCPCFFN